MDLKPSPGGRGQLPNSKPHRPENWFDLYVNAKMPKVIDRKIPTSLEVQMSFQPFSIFEKPVIDALAGLPTRAVLSRQHGVHGP